MKTAIATTAEALLGTAAALTASTYFVSGIWAGGTTPIWWGQIEPAQKFIQAISITVWAIFCMSGILMTGLVGKETDPKHRLEQLRGAWSIILVGAAPYFLLLGGFEHTLNLVQGSGTNMSAFTLGMVGLIISLYTLSFYPEKSRLSFPKKVSTDSEELFSQIVEVTLLLSPYALWSYAWVIWGESLAAALQGSSIPHAAGSIAGAGWTPAAFCLIMVAIVQIPRIFPKPQT